MKSPSTLLTTLVIGLTLALATTGTGMEQWTSNSYRSAVHVYQNARMYGRIARWLIDPENPATAACALEIVSASVTDTNTGSPRSASPRSASPKTGRQWPQD